MNPMRLFPGGIDGSATAIAFIGIVAFAAAAAGQTATWKGDELVAFRVHLPSRILHHNLRRLSDGAPGEPERGNILTYEQRLVDRRAGKPVSMDVRLETQPILYRTLLLFGGSFAAALVALGLVIWLIVRRGRRAAVRGPDV